MFVELNIDALVGPTHHFGGVGVGNLASQQHQRRPSSPKRGALQGLQKARLVASLGVPQFILPPLSRPLPDLLSQLGFHGTFAEQCAAARLQAPQAYSATFSSAFMWAANAGTFTPSCDNYDGRHHLTMANLSSSWHRWFEHAERKIQFEQMFASLLPESFAIHSALPPVMPLRDEGAANQMRLCDRSGTKAIHVLVYGEDSQTLDNTIDPQLPRSRFVARQTLAASQAIARLHGLDPKRTFFFQQHPRAIDAGVFHNDVIATSHRHVLLMHECAFLESNDQSNNQIDRLVDTFHSVTQERLIVLRVPEAEVSLSEAVSSYLFNSQLITPAEDRDAMVLICAEQCRLTTSVRRTIDRWIADSSNPISAVHYVSLDESMSGGGGPACLRLRMSLPESQINQFAPEMRLTDKTSGIIENWIQTHYPDELTWETLS